MNYSLLSLEYRKLVSQELFTVEGIPFCSFQKITKYCHLVKNCQKETGMRVTTMRSLLYVRSLFVFFPIFKRVGIGNS